MASRVLQIDAVRTRRGLIEIDQADAQQDWSQKLHAADADIAARGIQAERPALHAIGIEERNVGHARGEVAAAETRRRRYEKHQPKRRVGLGDEISERDGRDEQHRGAEDRPVAAAERRHCKRVGKAHQRADQSGQRDELKQLVGGVMEIGLRQFGRDDRPDQPDRKADMFSDDRPDEIAPGNKLALGFPKFLVLRIPFRNPARVPLAHCAVLLQSGQAHPVSRV